MKLTSAIFAVTIMAAVHQAACNDSEKRATIKHGNRRLFELGNNGAGVARAGTNGGTFRADLPPQGPHKYKTVHPGQNPSHSYADLRPVNSFKPGFGATLPKNYKQGGKSAKPGHTGKVPVSVHNGAHGSPVPTRKNHYAASNIKAIPKQG